MTNQYERIQQYLDGALEGKELQDFEKQLQADKELSEELALVKAVRPAIAMQQRIEEKEKGLNKTLEGFGAEFFPEESVNEGKRREMSPRRLLAIAASFLLLLGVLGIFYANQRFSSKALASNFLESPLKDTNMGQQDEEAILKTGKTAFFSADYDKTKQALQAIKRDAGPAYYEAKIFLAYTAFQEKDFKLAISQFTELLEKDFNQLPNTYKDANKLRWNRLLAFVGNEQSDLPLFKEELAYFLNNKSVFYQQKASVLKQDLENPLRSLVIE